MTRKDLLELGHRAAGARLFAQVAVKEFLARFAVEPPPTRVAASLAEGCVKASAEEVARGASPTDGLQDAGLDQLRQPGAELRRNGQLAVDEIEDQKLVRIERAMGLAADPFQEPHEARITELAVQGERNLPCVRVNEVGQALPLPDRTLEDPIGALARALDEATPCQRVGDAPVPGKLPVEDVLGGDARGEATWTHDLDPAWELADEDRAGLAVVAMRDGVIFATGSCL